MPVGHEELKALLGEYRGFGMFSLIRSLLFRGWRHAGLALVSLLLLAGQWVGPFGCVIYIQQLEPGCVFWAVGRERAWRIIVL